MGAGKAAESHNEGCNGPHRGHMAGTSTWGCSFVVCASSEGPLLIKGLFYFYVFIFIFLTDESCSLTCGWLLRQSSK